MSLSHEEIAKRFLQSEAVNFGALGKFVAEVGPELFVNTETKSDQGGVNLAALADGRFVATWYCENGAGIDIQRAAPLEPAARR